MMLLEYSWEVFVAGPGMHSDPKTAASRIASGGVFAPVSKRQSINGGLPASMALLDRSS